MQRPRILVAGLGNIFLGDDAFGVEVVSQLAKRPLPAGVRVVDFGIRGLDLTYALLDGFESVILVDALPRGGPAGTLYVLDPEVDACSTSDSSEPLIEAHNLNPLQVLRLVNSLGGRVDNLWVVGCEPQPLAEVDSMQMGLSPPVEAALDAAVNLIESLTADLLARGPTPDGGRARS
jgi:hydrogenase maturation protease